MVESLQRSRKRTATKCSSNSPVIPPIALTLRNESSVARDSRRAPWHVHDQKLRIAGESPQGHWTHSRDDRTTDLFRVTGKNAIWTPVSSVAMNWTTFHTQGLVKIGDTFYVTAVEVLESTTRNSTDTDALYDFSIDRSTGAGRG